MQEKFLKTILRHRSRMMFILSGCMMLPLALMSSTAPRGFPLRARMMQSFAKTYTYDEVLDINNMFPNVMNLTYEVLFL